MMNFEDDFELKEVQKLEGHTDKVWGLSWKSTDDGGTVIASCSGDKTVRIWKYNPFSDSFECTAVLEGHKSTVRSCSWSPLGKLLATASLDGTAAIWEQNARGDYVRVFIIKGHHEEVKSVIWDTKFYDNTLVTCGDKKMKLWKYKYKGNKVKCERKIMPAEDDRYDHKKEIEMVQFNPSSIVALFSCSIDHTIKVWSGYPGEDWSCIQTLDQSLSGHRAAVRALSFNATGNKMVSCSDDLTIKIWVCHVNLEESDDGYYPWEHLFTLSGCHEQPIFCVHWSGHEIISSGGADKAICLYVERKDGSGYRCLCKKEEAHDGNVNAVQWSPTDNGRLASASDDGTIKIWKLVSSPRKKKTRLF